MKSVNKDEGNAEKPMKELASNIPDDDSAVYGEHLSQDKRNRIMDFVERLGKGFDKKDVDKVNSNISSMNKGLLRMSGIKSCSFLRDSMKTAHRKTRL